MLSFDFIHSVYDLLRSCWLCVLGRIGGAAAVPHNLLAHLVSYMCSKAESRPESESSNSMELAAPLLPALF